MMRNKTAVVIDCIFVLVIISVIIIGGYIAKNTDKGPEPVRYSFTILEKDEEVAALYTDGEYVYAGTNNGIHIYDISSKELVRTIDSVKMIYTAAIVGDGEGGIWVGHEEGLSHFDRDFEQSDIAAPVIPEGRVNTVALSKDEIICGTYGGGAVLSKVNGKWTVTKALSKETGLPSDSVFVVLPLKDGIMIGSYLDNDGGITYISDSGKISFIDKAAGLPHPYVTSLIEDADGTVWAGTGYMRDGGLAKLVPDGNGYRIEKAISKQDGLPGEKVRYLFADEDTFWITSEYDGVVIVRDGKDNEYLTEESGLSDNEIKCIIAAGDDYWLGGKYGLTIIPKDHFK